MLFTLEYIFNITDFNIWFLAKYIGFEILKNLVELYLPLNMILFDFLCFCLCHVACGDLKLGVQPATEPGPLQWKRWLLTTGLPGNSYLSSFYQVFRNISIYIIKTIPF